MPRSRTRTARLALLTGGLATALLAPLAPASAQEVTPTPDPSAAATSPSPAATETASPSPAAASPSAAATTPAPTPSVAPSTAAPTAAPSTAAPAPTPAPAPVLRLGVSTTLVRGLGQLTVSGRMYRGTNSPAVGVVLDVLGRTPGTGGFARLGRMTTDATGLATLALVPRVSREYELRTAAAPVMTSGVAVVQVQPVLTGSLTPRVTELRRSSVLTGRLTPAYVGARLQVQRRLSSGWSTVASIATSSAGDYRWAVTPGATGRYVFRTVLPAAAAHRGAATLATDLVIEGRSLRSGDRGPDVSVLQQRLAAAAADVGPRDGVFGYDLRHAVTAFQKSQGLPRTGVYDKATSARLAAPRPVRLRYPSAGRAVEIDITKQVLYVSEGGHVTRIVDVSTGSDQLYESDGVTYRAFTPTGRFSVQRKIDGIRVSRLGELYRPAYFTQGWAIHGSASVPVYPASHGCVRVTDPAMDRLFGLLGVGVPVAVYRS